MARIPSVKTQFSDLAPREKQRLTRMLTDCATALHELLEDLLHLESNPAFLAMLPELPPKMVPKAAKKLRDFLDYQEIEVAPPDAFCAFLGRIDGSVAFQSCDIVTGIQLATEAKDWVEKLRGDLGRTVPQGEPGRNQKYPKSIKLALKRRGQNASPTWKALFAEVKQKHGDELSGISLDAFIKAVRRAEKKSK